MNELENYRFARLLGEGQARTWVAKSEATGEEVVVKTLSLARVSDWKGIELFEREAIVLKQLSHPAIPAFLDFIKDEENGRSRWHLVQEKVSGFTLAEQIYEDIDVDEKRLRDVSKQVLETLIYLQSYSPPLLHRDIKPENLIVEEDKIWLVDFGSVRHVIPSRMGGSTIVGTSGFMAPEQLLGRADRSSDLYALGMVLVNIVTKRSPEDLPQEDLRVLWKEHSTTELSPSFTYFLEMLIKPRIEERFENAEKALAILQSHYAPDSTADLIEKPLSNYVQEIQKKEIEKGIDEWREKINDGSQYVVARTHDRFAKINKIDLLFWVGFIVVFVLSIVFSSSEW